MSNTTRRDYYVDKYGEPCFGDMWRALSDRKKWYKPSKKAKKGQLEKIRIGRRRDLNKAMLHPDEDGEIMLPLEKKTDLWYYN